MTLANPSNYGINIKDDVEVRIWRDMLRTYLIKERANFTCEFCNRPLTAISGADMHEGIVTRANVPKGTGWQGLIFAECNVLILHPNCHAPIPPSKEWCWEWACKKYGETVVREWYYNLPWKAGKPPREF